MAVKVFYIICKYTKMFI